MADRFDWVDQGVEDALDPALPICDPHHHLWDLPDYRYVLDEILRDTDSGHNVRSTVFVECASMYRADGPEAMKPVGEVEFVNGIAAQSASGAFGDTRVAASIVGHADLTLGAAVADVLNAQKQRAPDRFTGIRHSAAFDSSDAIRNGHTKPTPGLLGETSFCEGFAQLAALDLSFDAWLFHPQISSLTALARAFPDTAIVAMRISQSGRRRSPNWRGARTCPLNLVGWA